MTVVDRIRKQTQSIAPSGPLLAGLELLALFDRVSAAILLFLLRLISRFTSFVVMKVAIIVLLAATVLQLVTAGSQHALKLAFSENQIS